MDAQRLTYGRPASCISVLAHVSGITAMVLMLVWLLHYRQGFDLDSHNPARIFNVHPFLMFFGFIFMAGEGMMAYKTLSAAHQAQKLFHMMLHLTAICLGIVGLHATFKYHDKMNLNDMNSLHSWIGITTFCLFILQFFFGFVTFLFPGARHDMKERIRPFHASFGRVLLYMAICTAETGLMQKATFLQLESNHENSLINFTAIAVLLFGIFVDLSVSLAM
uniref:ascorbate ferrireductase (transmembrane) n=1 Tax=Kalanchoe fedtschenkoi TaxID=63787 RepID=A0A7N0VC83_KALFE